MRRALTAVLLASCSAPARQGGERAVVVAPIVDLFLEPDRSSPVSTQAVLGTEVAVLAASGGFLRVRTPDGYEAWISEADVGVPPAVVFSAVVEVSSPLANVYPEPSYTRRAPTATLAMGTRVESTATVEAEGHRFFQLRLPDGTRAFLGVEDATPRLAKPADWIALGERLLETPYRWGGTTPFGFDCSGLTQFLLARHGVCLPRDAWQQAEDPRFETVAIGGVAPGDLLFFGDGGKVTHVGMSVGDGNVLEATTFGRPCVKVTPFDSPALKPRFLVARRLRAVAPPGAGRP